MLLKGSTLSAGGMGTCLASTQTSSQQPMEGPGRCVGLSPGGEGGGIQVPHQDAALTGDGKDGGAEWLPGHGGHVPLQAMLQRGDGGTAGEEGIMTKGKMEDQGSSHSLSWATGCLPVSSLQL